MAELTEMIDTKVGRDRRPRADKPGGQWRFVLPLDISERKLLLGLLDVLILNGALTAGLIIGPASPLNLGVKSLIEYLPWYLTLTGLWLIVASATDCYDLKLASSIKAGLPRLVCIAILVTGIYGFLPYVAAPVISSLSSWGLFVCAALSGIGLWRTTYALFIARLGIEQRVILVEMGTTSRASVALLMSELDSKARLVGVLRPVNDTDSRAEENVLVFDDATELLAHARRLDATDIVLDAPLSYPIPLSLMQAIVACQESGFRVTTMVHLFEQVMTQVPIRYVEDSLHGAFPLDEIALIHVYEFLKRALDVLCAVIGLAVLAVIGPAIAMVIALDSPGGVFYRQCRVGRFGRTYELIKFRTMVSTAEQDGEARWASRNDCRITRVGRFLRRTRLDELPQFWNVLIGQMSMVGPRPERPELVALLEQTIPVFRLRHTVLPGITGWAQVRQGYGGSVEDALIKLQYDLYYIKNRSMYLDLMILLKTIGVMLQMRGT